MKLMEDLHRNIASKMNEKARAIADEMAGGGCKNFEEYRLMVGRIRGLRDAADCINDAFKEFSEDE